MQLLLICIYVCVCLWCGNVYAVRVLFMHEDAPVGRQTTNIFDDNTRKDDLREATKKNGKIQEKYLRATSTEKNVFFWAHEGCNDNYDDNYGNFDDNYDKND